MATKYDYTSIVATATRLINRFGRTCTRNVITNIGTSFNPSQSINPIPITAVFTSFSKMEVDGTLILATDKKMLTYDEVLLTDTILDDSIEYTVMNVDTIQTGDTKIIFKVQLRR